MAKKQQPRKDAFLRMNYLLQASILLASHRFATKYTRDLLAIQQKSVQRLDPSIKRVICKCCCSVQVKANCSVEIVTEREEIIKFKCKICNNERKLPIKEKPLYNDIHGKKWKE